VQPDFRDNSLHDDFGDDSLHDIIPDDGCVSALDALEHKELLSLLVERLAPLPELQSKVLVMYYYQNARLSEIAAIFALTESRISQIRGQAVTPQTLNQAVGLSRAKFIGALSGRE
jgi:RNA polymerase sigma factor for flagellar operon FliA